MADLSSKRAKLSDGSSTTEPGLENAKTTTRLQDLRALMSQYNVSAYLIPGEDEHQSEYIADSHKRREFVSGFSGSAGHAVVTLNKAALWTDGRYFLQAAKELDGNWILMKANMQGTPTRDEWLKEILPQGSNVSVDPKLLTYADVKNLKAKLSKAGHNLVAINDNLIDLIWKSRPSIPARSIVIQELNFAGTPALDKLHKLASDYRAKGCVGYLASALDEIAWLLNLRGSDIDYNPVFFAYFVVTDDHGATLFADSSKIDENVSAYLHSFGVKVLPCNDLTPVLKQYGLELKNSGKKILIPPVTSWAIVDALGEEVIEEGSSPVVTAKSVKNLAELEGFRQCHIRDAVALCSFFAWLENEIKSGNETLTEASVAAELENFRRKQEHFMGLSFATISSMGANAAIIHYKPEFLTAAKINAKEIYLCDSGAQYRDGTTDVTRTLHFGTPTEEEKECFTRVLKGHIALDCAVFPKGTTGYLLDILARHSLWQVGLDYRHGTGHGVGAFLNVHEGPHGIGTKAAYNEVGLEIGMTVTNEPGFYKDGHFGIRIENVLVVKDARTPNNFSGHGYLGFEHLTLVPIQKKLIQNSLLSPNEVTWINNYHAECRLKVGSLMTPGSLAHSWMMEATEPL